MPLKFQADCVGQGSGLRYSLWECWFQDGGLPAGGLWEEPSESCLWSGKQAGPAPVPVELGELWAVVPNWVDDQALGMGCFQKGGSYNQERVITGVRLTCEPSYSQLWGDEHFRPGEKGPEGPAQHPRMAA